MKKSILDLTGCKYPQELHARFQKALHFPAYYGRNWDAFWDSIMNDTEVDFVEIRGESKVASELHDMLEKLHSILDEVKQVSSQQGWQFDYKIVD
jgi:RNAse (barnase) inhibitor barstar